MDRREDYCVSRLIKLGDQKNNINFVTSLF